MSDENVMRVAQILTRTLELNAEVRKDAENELRSLEKVEGFGPILIQLICNPQVSTEIRISAAVTVKNFVKRNWSETAEVELSSVEENAIRSSALEAMFNSSGNLQKQLSHTVYLMAKKDFPERWPNLVSSLVVHLNGENLEKLVATISTMDQLFKKYRFESKSTALWQELKLCLTVVQEPLTNLFIKMLEFTPQKDSLPAEAASQWLEVLLFIAKVYHSLVSQDLPEYFEDHLTPWMNGFLQLLSLNVDSQQSGAGEYTVIDKLKAEICCIVTLYAQRYEEEIKPHMQNLITSIWGLLVHTGQETRYDSMVCSALDFLTAICQRAQYEDMFTAENVLKTIAMDVAVRNLMLREDDIEQFEDEPLEYIKKDIEGTDSGTRRRGAIDLVRGLCRRFENALVPILSEAVSSFLSDPSNWMKRDVVYCLVTAMASRTETARSGATSTSPLINITDYYANNVRGDLCSADVNSTPILKADALKFIVTFRMQLPPEALVEAVTAMVGLLSSSAPILHKYTAYALEKLLLVKVNGVLLFNASNAPVSQLLSALVAGFDADDKAQNSAYLIKALMRVVNIIDPSTAKAAGQIASRLVTMVEAVTKNPADPVHTHFLFETMCLLIKKTSGHVTNGLDAQLLPLIETILTQDLADLVPYALQITGLLLIDCVSRGCSTNAYFGFLPYLLGTDLWAKSSNIPAALSVIESYLKVSARFVLTEHGQTIMGQYTRLISSRNLDNYGFQLANAMLPAMEHVCGVDSPITVILNAMFKRAQTNRTPKFTKLFIIFIGRFSIVRGADFVARAMESIQPGLFKMVMERVVTPALVDLKSITNNEEKRIIAIGFANILGGCTTELGDTFGTLALNIVALTEAAPVVMNIGQTQSLEDEQVSMYNSEGEFTNPFCKLSYAPREELLAPQIVNYKKFLADAIVQRAASVNPAVMHCLTDDVKSVLRGYMQLS